MADIAPEEGFLQKELECGVCLNTYDLQNHIPIALQCLHTFCETCIDKLRQKPSVKCPKCKRTCEVHSLSRNFALCDVVEKLCWSCRGGEVAAQCEHCDRKLCSRCLEIHAQTLEGDVEQNLDDLRKEMRKSAETTMDETAIKAERKHAASTIEQIQKAITKYRQEIQKLEENLKRKVTELRTLNIKNHVRWQENITAKIGQCKKIILKSEDTLETTHGTQSRTKSLSELNAEALKFLADLRDMQKSSPEPTKYKFEIVSQSPPDVGEIVSQSAPDVGEIASHSATSGRQLTPVDYTRARSIAVSGSQGAGPEQFASVGYVTCTDDRYIVCDTHNNRIKVYDRNLRVTLIFGEEGDRKDQFRKPRGLCVSPSGKLYVNDSGNHRIKVYNKSYQVIRIFGSKGSGNDQLDDPEGLAFTPTGELLVADWGNYPVKVLTREGSYIRSIGSEGQRPGQFRKRPVGVAATPDGHVLVSEWCASRLLMFTLSGDYVRDITPGVPNVQEDVQISEVTVDREGNIVIADCGNHQLIVLGAHGEFLCLVERKRDQLGELWGLMSVAVNSNRVLVYEEENNRIQVFEI